MNIAKEVVDLFIDRLDRAFDKVDSRFDRIEEVEGEDFQEPTVRELLGSIIMELGRPEYNSEDD